MCVFTDQQIQDLFSYSDKPTICGLQCAITQWAGPIPQYQYASGNGDGKLHVWVVQNRNSATITESTNRAQEATHSAYEEIVVPVLIHVQCSVIAVATDIEILYEHKCCMFYQLSLSCGYVCVFVCCWYAGEYVVFVACLFHILTY